MIIKLKINMAKVDNAKLFNGKNGAKYLDVTLLENRDGVDQYGNNGMVVQDVTKEERESGNRGAILGNFKIMGGKTGSAPAARPAATPKPTAPDTDFVPF